MTGGGREPAPPAARLAELPVSRVNLPNALTVVRLLLVPIFAALLLAGGGGDAGLRVAAFAVFAVASLTDLADGDIARRRGLVTDFGTIADPIADKALTGTALVGLSLLGELAWLVTAVILVREVGITALRFGVIRHGVLPASRGGKAKTVLQGLGISLYLLPLPAGWSVLATATMALAVAVTVVTGLDYVARALALRRAGLRRG